jgi:26S proteasome regulatory subunit N10
MVLEATMLVLDNSEWMRNGDYIPNRYDAQNDAIQLVFNAKRQMNPENAVGIVSASGTSPKVLVTLTQDHGKIISALHQVNIGGSSNVLDAIQIAQLALKHRQNKNQQQRIIIFVASPLTCTEEDLTRVAKLLKKNGIAADVINFGEDLQNTVRLEAFISAINNNDNSHLVTIPPGSNLLSDALVGSPILGHDSAMQFEFGVDPDLDPELALALRMSLEEERARQTSQTSTTQVNAIQSEPSAITDEEAELARAIAMSMENPNADMESDAPTQGPGSKRKYSEDKDLK